jgi:hypothetical protein
MTDAEIGVLAQVIADSALTDEDRRVIAWAIVSSDLNLDGRQGNRFLKIAAPSSDPTIIAYLASQEAIF